MKIVQINAVCGIKSTGRIAGDLALFLTENGHECMVAYGREKAPKQFESIAYRIGKPRDVLMNKALTVLLDGAGHGSIGATKRFIRKLEEYNPDLIHLHNIKDGYLNIPILFEFLKGCGKPVLWTNHDCWAFTGNCSHFIETGCEQWKTGCENCRLCTRYPFRIPWINRSKSNFTSKRRMFSSIKRLHIAVPSEWLGGVVRQSFLAGYPISVVPNGIDLTQFKPTKNDIRRKYGIGDKRIVLSVASAWTKRKGMDLLYRLSRELESQTQFVMVGLLEKQLPVDAKNIIAVPRTDSVSELCQWYTAADVLANASLQETMGMTTIEAMACGTPAVVFNSTALPELVTPQTGAVIQVNDYEGYRTALLSLKKDENACATQASRYSKEVFCEKYVSIYRRMI